MKKILLFTALMSICGLHKAQLLSENFDGTQGSALPSGWTTTNQTQPSTLWYSGNDYYNVPVLSKAAMFGAVIVSPYQFFPTTDATLISPVMDLSNYPNATLSFKAFVSNVLLDPDCTLYAEAYTGTAWVPIWSSAGQQLGSAAGTEIDFFQVSNISLSAFSNSDFRIRFIYSTGNAFIAFGAVLDDVIITNGSLSTVETKNNAAKISVFPNPATDYFKIKGLQDETTPIKLVDISGKVIRIYKNTSIYQLSGVSPGVYFVVSDLNKLKEKIIVK